MARTPCCDDVAGLKRGAWTPEEDEILRAFVLRHGHGNWRTLPKRAGLLRCGKSCRFRWTNYLNPTVRRGNYTREEEETIIRLHDKLGNRWSVIAAELPGRTDNEIKNVWHTHLKKRKKLPKYDADADAAAASDLQEITQSSESSQARESQSTTCTLEDSISGISSELAAAETEGDLSSLSSDLFLEESGLLSFPLAINYGDVPTAAWPEALGEGLQHYQHELQQHDTALMEETMSWADFPLSDYDDIDIWS